MPMEELAPAISSLKAIAEIVKFIQESSRIFEKAEMKLKLAELYTSLSEARMELAGVSELLIAKDEEIRGLQAQQNLEKEVFLKLGAYWRRKDSGEEDGPFCTRCWDLNKHLLRLRTTNYKKGAFCPECKTGFDRAFP